MLEEAFSKTSFEDGTRMPNRNLRSQAGEMQGIHNWQLIRKGMSPGSVRRLLGEPAGHGEWSGGPTWDDAQTSSVDYASIHAFSHACSELIYPAVPSNVPGNV